MLSLLQFKRRNTEASVFNLLFWWICVPWFVTASSWVLWRLRVRGRENLPRTGGALVIANHQSNLDPLLMGAVLNDRAPRMLARRTLQTDSPWPVPWMLRVGCRVIFVDQETADPGAMKAVIAELKAGRVSVVFPEGTRSVDGTMLDFERGVWLLIKRGGQPVLPIGIEGAFDVWPRKSRLRLRGRIVFHIGEPIPCEDLLAMGVDQALAFLHERVDTLRAEARAAIRVRSGGRWPLAGPADIQNGSPSCTAGT